MEDQTTHPPAPRPGRARQPRPGIARQPRPRARAAMRAALDGHHPFCGRIVPFTITGFILATGIAIAIETMPSLSPETRWWLRIFEIFAACVFGLEYALRLSVARRPLGYALSFWGIIDLVAFLPTLLLLGGDTLALQTLRLLRLLRLLKLLKRETVFGRLWGALTSIFHELTVVALAAFLMIYLAAVGIHIFEHRVQPEEFGSIPQSLWWALVTLTTVGYGDVVPITAGGRIFAGMVILVGLGVVAMPTALITASLMDLRRKERETLERDAARRERHRGKRKRSIHPVRPLRPRPFRRSWRGR